jgi:PKD repeat protein
MNRIMNLTLKRLPMRVLLSAIYIISLAMQVFIASPAIAAAQIPVLWTAGGLSAGNDSAGQAARIATDASGNVAVVSGPAFARDLAVTSYAADGTFRWRNSVSPNLGTFVGDWVAAAPNGDFVAVGRNTTSRGQPIAITLVRFASDGTLQWRVDLARTIPWVGRLVVDGAGNAYLAFNSVGDGQDIQLHKYSPSGVLLWSQVISTSFFANDYATSLALSPDETTLVLTGDIVGGATWITAAYDTATGTRNWLVTADEGTAASDVVVDATRVYVTGTGVTDPGTPAMKYLLTVVAYDRATGARLWRTNTKPADSSGAAGLRISKAPDGSLVVAGHASRGFLDWYIVSFETTGTVRWEAIRDGGLNTDEIPRGVLVLADGTTVVTGRGGPNLPGGYWPGVTAGYSPNGTLLWEAFSAMETVWATALPNGDVCTTGGYDALITCFRVSGTLKAVMSATPSNGTAPLSVTFDGSGSTTPSGTITSWAWSFGDGAAGTGPQVTHVYPTPGTYTASLTVTDSGGASSTATGSIVVNPLPPTAPSGLTATLSDYLVQLAWQDNSLNETLFHIERCQGVGCTSFAAFATQWPNTPSYTDYSAITGQSYSYRVRAYNSGGYSSYSNVASILAGGSTPSPTPVPTNTPPASSTSTGFLSPSANASQTSSAGDNNGYQTSPANAYANDLSVATDINSGTNTSTSCTNNGKDKHRYSNYNFNLPATAVIQGIQVRLDARADSTSGSPKLCVQLSWDGGITWTTARSTTTLGTTETTYALGGSSDTWGRTWTPSSFNNPNFRVRVINVASNANRDFFLDYVAVNVTYQP